MCQEYTAGTGEADQSLYSRLCHNPYLSVDNPGYGVLESMY
jgi:hypothetical protein